MFQIGEQIGGVVINFPFPTEDMANVIPRAYIHAALHLAGVETLIHIANVLDAKTSANLLQVMVSTNIQDSSHSTHSGPSKPYFSEESFGISYCETISSHLTFNFFKICI